MNISRNLRLIESLAVMIFCGSGGSFRIVCFTYFILLLPLSSPAITKIDISPDSDWAVTLVEDLELLPDEEKKWTLEAILQNENLPFTTNPDSKPRLHTYWARFILSNPGASDEYLTILSRYWDKVNIYVRDSSDNIEILKIGILQDQFNSDFIIHGRSKVLILAKFESSGQFRREDNINLILKKTISELNRLKFRNFMDGIIFGIIFGLAIYNFFIFLSLREQIYFWYSLYVFTYSVAFICLYVDSPSQFTQYFLPHSPHIAIYLKNISDPLIWISLIQFTRLFLQTKINLPRWDWLLKILFGLTILQFVINFMGIVHFSGVPRIAVWQLSIIFCSIIALKALIKGYTRARFFIFAQLFQVVSAFLAFSYYLKFDPIHFLPHTQLFDYFRTIYGAFGFGAVEAIAFSLALAEKYKFLQRDIIRVNLEKEQEKKVMLASQKETLEKTGSGENPGLKNIYG